MNPAKNPQMNNYNLILDMTILAAGGWLISLQEIETLARIISLLVPAALSILLYLKNQKKNGRKEK
ncbi:hypothetical protein [Brumimicrobium aurantiacum]|uniref:Uncharacterized protein n=1 Tax=Brumimicrobium aurantiacum TaxID=1737063 RepID=A0A3E1EUL6_9FLAO|nr:hypothetical protein [Brumimicrobium aurantiacum]RFC53247.1 hypothetical protein DXU93_14375 [Brumimicrobium aurantiacum]